MGKQKDNEIFAELNQRWLGVRADGWAGPKTQSAWRSRTGFDGAATGRAASPFPRPDERSLVEYYGPPGESGLVLIRTPYPMRLAWDHGVTAHRIRCHRLVAESLVLCLQDIFEHYGSLEAVQAARMDLFAGCYYKRPQRGGRAWSLHAWGAAVDLDSKQNGNLTPWPSEATMPVEVVDIFEARGWRSGARSWGRDAMHFEGTS